MQKKQCAIMDFGSSKVTAVVAERGVNGTFLIKGRYAFPYDGFSNGAFYDVEKVKKIIMSAVEHIKKSTNVKVDTIYVGVPSAFTKVELKNCQISFDRKKKILSSDVDRLFDVSFAFNTNSYTLINRSAIVYELGDYRKVANPVGLTSEVLKGRLSFICASNYFVNLVKQAIIFAGVQNVEFVSVSLAESLYLIEPETRDRIALICDVGYIDSSLCIIQGDGIIYQKDIEFGGGFITANISEAYELDFDIAEKIKRKTNLSKRTTSVYDVIDGENGKYYAIDEIKKIVFSSLDTLCEEINNAIEHCGFIIPEYVPLKITGGGITFLRGAKEYIADRLGMVVEIVSPKVPLSEKPTESSILSVLDLASGQ